MHGCHGGLRLRASLGRWFAARGHTVRLIAPQFVAAFRKGGKNDAADAEAVAIAARQPTMRFVPIKTIDQQTILAWHCAREAGRKNVQRS
jgi:transposase